MSAAAGTWRSKRLAYLVGLGLIWLVTYPLLLTLLEAVGGFGALTLEHFAEFAGRADEWRALRRTLCFR